MNFKALAFMILTSVSTAASATTIDIIDVLSKDLIVPVKAFRCVGSSKPGIPNASIRFFNVHYYYAPEGSKQGGWNGTSDIDVLPMPFDNEIASFSDAPCPSINDIVGTVTQDKFFPGPDFAPITISRIIQKETEERDGFDNKVCTSSALVQILEIRTSTGVIFSANTSKALKFECK